MSISWRMSPPRPVKMSRTRRVKCARAKACTGLHSGTPAARPAKRTASRSETPPPATLPPSPPLPPVGWVRTDAALAEDSKIGAKAAQKMAEGSSLEDFGRLIATRSYQLPHVVFWAAIARKPSQSPVPIDDTRAPKRAPRSNQTFNTQYFRRSSIMGKALRSLGHLLRFKVKRFEEEVQKCLNTVERWELRASL